jgi:hypothetical protein
VENDAWWLYNVVISHCDVASWDSAIRAGYVSGLGTCVDVTQPGSAKTIA